MLCRGQRCPRHTSTVPLRAPGLLSVIHTRDAHQAGSRLAIFEIAPAGCIENPGLLFATQALAIQRILSFPQAGLVQASLPSGGHRRRSGRSQCDARAYCATYVRAGSGLICRATYGCASRSGANSPADAGHLLFGQQDLSRRMRRHQGLLLATQALAIDCILPGSNDITFAHTGFLSESN